MRYIEESKMEVVSGGEIIVDAFLSPFPDHHCKAIINKSS